MAAEITRSAAYRFRVGEEDINIENFLEHVYELQLLLWLARRSSLPKLLPRLSGTSSVLESADRRLARVLERVFQLLHQTCGDCSGGQVFDLWQPILDRVSSIQTTVPIFTLNYDWTFEKLAVEKPKRYHLVDGFELLGGEWDAKRFLRKPAVRKINLSLFKLHGSTNWVGEDVLKSMGKFDAGGFHMVYPGHAHEMSLGDEYWSPSPDGWIDREPFKTLHGRFCDAIRSAELLVVIGYAFHDDRVNQEIIEQVGRRKRLKLLVVDPGIKRYVKRTDSSHVDPPFEWLKFSHHGTPWSQFYWFEGDFGTPVATQAILDGLDRLLPHRRAALTLGATPRRKSRSSSRRGHKPLP